MTGIEFFFDLSSPWTRLAFHNVRRFAAQRDVTIRWRPILVGGVFNAVNPALYERRAETDSPKMRHAGKILADWARLAGVAMNFPSPHHPLRSVTAMRCCCALEDDQARLAEFAEAAFHAYFADQRNLDDPAELAAIADGIGLDGKALLEGAASDPVKARLRANTDALIARGGYGSPTLFVHGDDMYFGNDQLPLVYAALEREPSR
ncbi:MAG: 2-hydroxychromene-2-carboxylate isomerase [Blastomonas sp.]